MSASSRTDFSVEQDRNDETRDAEDCNFPALRLNYDRQAHARHSNNFLNVDSLQQKFHRISIKILSFINSRILFQQNWIQV